MVQLKAIAANWLASVRRPGTRFRVLKAPTSTRFWQNLFSQNRHYTIISPLDRSLLKESLLCVQKLDPQMKATARRDRSALRGTEGTIDQDTSTVSRRSKRLRSSRPNYAEKESSTEDTDALANTESSTKRKRPRLLDDYLKKGANDAAKKSRQEKASVEDTDASPKPSLQKDVKDAQELDAEDDVRQSKATRTKPLKQESEEKKPQRQIKTKNEKDSNSTTLAERTSGLKLYIGAHVSAAKGIENSVTNSIHIGGNAFALFLKSQRKWVNPPLQKGNQESFISACKKHDYDAARHVLPHCSYLVNLAQADPAKADQAYNCFVDDLHRCERLGIMHYNFHPGAAGSAPRNEGISRIAAALNRAHKETSTVITLLENMATRGTIIGGTFEDLAAIIAEVEDKSRVGVCFDTCHAFASGYDLRTPSAFSETMAEFDKVIGLKYLKAMHINDSKAPFASGRDLHQNIGLGFLGLRSFYNVMNFSQVEGLPLVLETPIDHKDKETGKPVENKGIWAREIKLLESLIGMDVNSEEFEELERDLAKKGEAERKQQQETYDKKVAKEKRATGKKDKGKRKT